MNILLLASATPHSPLVHTPLEIGRQLAESGHSVTMLALTADKYSKWQPDQPPVLHGVRIKYPFQLRTKSQLNLLPYLVHTSLLTVIHKYDLIYVYKSTPIAAIGVLPKWFRRSRLVLHTDDLDWEVMKEQEQPKAMWLIVKWCERLLARNTDAIVAGSRLLETDYRRRFPSKPILRLPNGVDPTEFKPAPTPELGRVPRLIFFGILGRTRILSVLLKSLPAVIQTLGPDRVQVEILGDGPCREEIEGISKKLKLTNNVHFRGWTTYDQLHSYISYGDVGLCVMPRERTTEACSNQKIFQYMALGLATVVSDVGDLPLYTEDGHAGLIVPSGDTHQLSQAIQTLLTDSTLRLKLAATGRPAR